MKDFSIASVNQSEINKYLYFKNLEINRKYSSNKKIIKKLDHYIWWFQNQKKRQSKLINKDKLPVYISTADFFYYKNKKFIYSGLISCLDETNLFDILKAIKIQNNYLDKKKGYTCIISIDKNNKVLMKHWKYFGYKPMLKRVKFYNTVKKYFKIGNQHNIYFKKI